MQVSFSCSFVSINIFILAGKIQIRLTVPPLDEQFGAGPGCPLMVCASDTLGARPNC
jgi:hypothetical protein